MAKIKYFTEEIALTALCIWDEIGLIHDDQSEPWYHYRQNWGTAQLRQIALDLAPYCNAHYDMATHGEFDGSFDWDFVPMWIRLCVDWPQDVPDNPTARVKSLKDAVRLLEEQIAADAEEQAAINEEQWRRELEAGGTL